MATIAPMGFARLVKRGSGIVPLLQALLKAARPRPSSDLSDRQICDIGLGEAGLPIDVEAERANLLGTAPRFL